jgi:hypothetical protein
MAMSGLAPLTEGLGPLPLAAMGGLRGAGVSSGTGFAGLETIVRFFNAGARGKVGRRQPISWVRVTPKSQGSKGRQ